MGLEEELPIGFPLTGVEPVAGWWRKPSVFPATFGLVCCAIETLTIRVGILAGWADSRPGARDASGSCDGSLLAGPLLARRATSPDPGTAQGVPDHSARTVEGGGR